LFFDLTLEYIKLPVMESSRDGDEFRVELINEKSEFETVTDLGIYLRDKYPEQYNQFLLLTPGEGVYPFAQFIEKFGKLGFDQKEAVWIWNSNLILNSDQPVSEDWDILVGEIVDRLVSTSNLLALVDAINPNEEKGAVILNTLNLVQECNQYTDELKRRTEILKQKLGWI
jgi:hypothetical protein